MRKLRIAVIELVVKAPTRWVFGRIMNANQASIMPQVIAHWCEQEGHDVEFICYTGLENLFEELPTHADLVFIGAYTQAGQLSYAISNLMRSRGAVTVLGGPHARCYPQDALKYFDYVLGFTDREVLRTVLRDCSRNRPVGVNISAKGQALDLPGVRERWKFIKIVLQKAPLIKGVSMIGSLGCPYTCSFCIDSVVPYQQLSFDVIQDDLRFLLQKFKKPNVGWHDPNFGIRFDEYLDAIEEAVPPGSINFFAESSLSLLSEPNLKRLRKNGFKAVLPGIESWHDMGNKSKTGSKRGIDKVHLISEHVNMVLHYIPYIQTNFVLGLDVDDGPEPFELTKRFIDLAPGAFPAISLLTAFGQAAPLNLEYQKAGRVLPFPFHFMNNNHVMNVSPKNYSWPEFYDHLVDLQSCAFSRQTIVRRFKAGKKTRPRWLPWVNVLRAVCSEGFGRIKYYTALRQMLESDRQIRRFWEGETAEIPPFYVDWMKRDLGAFWKWLPEGALYHDTNAYLKSEMQTKQVENTAHV
ncbi:radical SAM protein [candidate division KSB1 bacterium]|nr:radical SAM protein [candidate division KSB1 bacterium]NIR70198.1 radical SAM protein [candidate division KSB1 bacterium]NIS27585.1 radical SAM protein [candidate division KSB1 bacterium]NIT74437.1 radical SAM protein [candidate division KSB1 bacterium]NIU28302.1 radical SAM protein [candidate division KSB1 bacterium]